MFPVGTSFGNMTLDDDLKDAGEHIKIVGRWHYLSGDGGVCICETDNVSALNSFMLNWAPICDIKVSPMVDDAMSRANSFKVSLISRLRHQEKRVLVIPHKYKN